MKKIGVLTISLTLFLLCAKSAYATPPEPPPHYFDIDVEADAIDQLNGTWLYVYTLSKVDRPGYVFKEMSHWWIELPEHKIPTLSGYDPAGATNRFPENKAPDGIYTTLGNPFNGWHDGVKWDSDQLITYSFISTHGPVLDENGEVDETAYSWFAVDGVGYYDYSATLGPNGNGAIPEPASLMLLGCGLFGFGIARRRKL